MTALQDPAKRLPRFWLCILFLAQFALFYQYARREVIGAYPFAFDQAFYLSVVYSLSHSAILHKAFFKTLFGYFLTAKEAHGPMLILHGVFFQLFFGPGRMSALLINFFYFCLLEFFIFITARWLAKRDSMGWLAVGLLMLCDSTFFSAGGLFDFRIDFIASCLYGIFLCLVVRSNGLQERRWLAGAVICGLLLVSFRTITFFYITGLFMLLLAGMSAALFFEKKRGQKERAALLIAMAKKLLAFFLSWFVLASPIILFLLSAIRAYYGVGTVSGEEKHIRAAEFGITGLSGHLTFYIDSLLVYHLGYLYLIVWATLVAFALGSSLVCSGKNNTGRLMPENFPWITFFFVIAAIISPWLILTVIESKSPVVISILDVPVTLIVIILLTCGCRINESRVSGFSSRACSVTAACIMLVGCGNWMEQLSHAGLVNSNPESVKQVDVLYDYLMNEAEENGIKSPVISCDFIADWLSCLAVADRIYEKHGIWLDTQGGLGASIFSINHDEVFKKIGKSDFVLLTDLPKEGPYPFFASMNSMEPEMRAWCETHLIHGREFQIYNGKVTVYIRPGIKLEGTSADKWITPEGFRFQLTDELLAWLRTTSKTRLVFEGDYNPNWLPKEPQAALQLLDASGTPTAPDTTSVSFTRLESGRYRLGIDLEKLLADHSLKGGSYVIIRLENSYFIPKEIGVNDDTRKLVVPEPATIRFE